VEGNAFTLANGVVANKGFQAITPTSEKTFFEEQASRGVP
jgi:hypothetical protein